MGSPTTGRASSRRPPGAPRARRWFPMLVAGRLDTRRWYTERLSGRVAGCVRFGDVNIALQPLHGAISVHTRRVSMIHRNASSRRAVATGRRSPMRRHRSDGARQHARGQAPSATALPSRRPTPPDGVPRSRRCGAEVDRPPATTPSAGCHAGAVLRIADPDGDACVAAARAQRPPAGRAAERRRHRQGPVAGLPRRRRAAALGHRAGR